MKNSPKGHRLKILKASYLDQLFGSSAFVDILALLSHLLLHIMSTALDVPKDPGSSKPEPELEQV